MGSAREGSRLTRKFYQRIEGPHRSISIFDAQMLAIAPNEARERIRPPANFTAYATLCRAAHRENDIRVEMQKCGTAAKCAGFASPTIRASSPRWQARSWAHQGCIAGSEASPRRPPKTEYFAIAHCPQTKAESSLSTLSPDTR